VFAYCLESEAGECVALHTWHMVRGIYAWQVNRNAQQRNNTAHHTDVLQDSNTQQCSSAATIQRDNAARIAERHHSMTASQHHSITHSTR
jgi:hypothetical protein